MAYAIVHHFPGGTQSQYEASIAAVHPADGHLNGWIGFCAPSL